MSNQTESGTYRVDDLLSEEVRNLSLEQILTLLVSKIVKHPSECEINIAVSPKIRVIEFAVHAEDRGPLLGRSGYTISALRTLSKAMLGPDNRNCSYHVNLSRDEIAKRFTR